MFIEQELLLAKSQQSFFGCTRKLLKFANQIILEIILDISFAFYKGIWNNWIVKIQAVQRSERAFQTKENFTQWIIGQSKALICLIFVFFFLHNRNLRPRNCTRERLCCICHPGICHPNFCGICHPYFCGICHPLLSYICHPDRCHP